MSDTDRIRSIIPQKPPPPPRREAGDPLHPSDPIEMPEPATPPTETPLAPAQPRETSPSRPPASRRERERDGRIVIPSRPSEPEIVSRRQDRATLRADHITTSGMRLLDFSPRTTSRSR